MKHYLELASRSQFFFVIDIVHVLGTFPGVRFQLSLPCSQGMLILSKLVLPSAKRFLLHGSFVLTQRYLVLAYFLPLFMLEDLGTSHGELFLPVLDVRLECGHLLHEGGGSLLFL